MAMNILLENFIMLPCAYNEVFRSLAWRNVNVNESDHSCYETVIMSYLKRDRDRAPVGGNVICHSIWMMRSDVFLSLKEATRSAVLDRVVKGEMTAAEGAARLGMSRRQIFRLKAKILTWGISSLSHFPAFRGKIFPVS